MKITTQRSIIWLANFALVGGLLVFVWLMSQNSPSRRSQRMKSVIDDLDTRLRAEHGPPPRTGTQAGGAMVKTIFDPNFHYAGYVPPPEPVPVAVTPAGVEKAPPLDTLISVSLISAPGSSVITSDSPVGSDDVIGALVVVKSKPQDKNVRWYRVGDVIGITKDPTNKIDDEDPTMKKWNGAQILEIRDDRIVCQWSDQTVDVVIGQSPSLTGMTIKMSDGSVVGSLGGSGGPTNANRAGPTSSGAFLVG
ncbi:MAG: hypothetical protein KDB53_00785, partial [Planctomycetes bacterium]|nr:hypothetical protein [Planctomycetota bacterium]